MQFLCSNPHSSLVRHELVSSLIGVAFLCVLWPAGLGSCFTLSPNLLALCAMCDRSKRHSGARSAPATYGTYGAYIRRRRSFNWSMRHSSATRMWFRSRLPTRSQFNPTSMLTIKDPSSPVSSFYVMNVQARKAQPASDVACVWTHWYSLRSFDSSLCHKRLFNPFYFFDLATLRCYTF
ncbi:hypothetical protein C8R47DRAFT_110653 [Mycena vitilis]|nr:hypothetical protein C8R47DRAFT_110653 [Mycena vitilis]